MAAYPSLVLATSTRVVPRMGVKYDTAVDGSFRGVALHTVESYDITIEHLWLSDADAGTLETFWSSNKYISWTFTWRSVSYTCYFLGKPLIYPVEGGLWNAQVRAIGS